MALGWLKKALFGGHPDYKALAEQIQDASLKKNVLSLLERISRINAKLATMPDAYNYQRLSTLRERNVQLFTNYVIIISQDINPVISDMRTLESSSAVPAELRSFLRNQRVVYGSILRGLHLS